MKDLFNQDIPDVAPKPLLGKFKSWKAKNQYRKTKGDRRCGTCRNLTEEGGNTANYFKCKLMGISSSAATDIRKSYVCNLWKGGERGI